MKNAAEIAVSLEKLMEGIPENAGDEECWEWEGARNTWNYGSVATTLKGRASVGAHRASAVLLGGMDPEGLYVRHKCDNPPCVNPGHLEVGTPQENSQDMSDRGRSHSANRTHCPQGHEYSDENTMFSNRGGRVCRVCDREAKRRYWIKKTRTPEFVVPHAERTHCPKGHEYTKENTMVSKYGSRACRECTYSANLKRYHQRRQEQSNGFQ